MSEATLPELRAFAAVARHRSFQQAADALGVSRSSLSHALRALEQRLGVRLLHRTTRSVAATEAGDRLLRRLVPLLGELDGALDEVRHGLDALAGALRINTNPAGARWLLRHVVGPFAQRHPRIRLDLVTEGRLVDIVAEGFDAGVRLAEAVPQDMIAVPFGGDVRFIAVAAPTYVARHGRPATPDELRRHNCIRHRLPSGKLYRWEFAKGGQEIVVDVPGSLSLNDNGLMVQAATEGLGVAFVPEPVAREALVEGRLVALLEDWSPPIGGLCLYYSSHRHVPPPLKAFVAVLREARETAPSSTSAGG